MKVKEIINFLNENGFIDVEELISQKKIFY